MVATASELDREPWPEEAIERTYARMIVEFT